MKRSTWTVHIIALSLLLIIGLALISSGIASAVRTQKSYPQSNDTLIGLIITVGIPSFYEAINSILLGGLAVSSGLFGLSLLPQKCEQANKKTRPIDSQKCANLLQYKELLDKGIITAEEFAQYKGQFLDT